MNHLPRWRVVAALAVLAALAAFGVLFAPIYLHNVELQGFVSELAAGAGAQAQADDVLRSRVLDKAHDLGLPVKEGDVHIDRSGGGMRIEVRYFVRVDMPGYTVNLHFYPRGGQPVAAGKSGQAKAYPTWRRWVINKTGDCPIPFGKGNQYEDQLHRQANRAGSGPVEKA